MVVIAVMLAVYSCGVLVITVIVIVILLLQLYTHPYTILCFILSCIIRLPTMAQRSQKDKDKPKPKQPQSTQYLSMVPTAAQVTLLMPAHLQHVPLEMPLLAHYVKAKLVQKKRISLREPICATVFGRQEVLYVREVKEIVNPNVQPKEASEKMDTFVVNGQISVILTFDKASNEGKGMLDTSASQYYGDSEEYNSFRKLVWQNFKLRQKLAKVKLGSIRGIIMGGPTGTGKTTFINRLKEDLSLQQIEGEQKIYFHTISATQLLSRVVGGAEEYVRKTFKSLREHRYAVFVIEDMHLLFGEKELASHETTLAALFSEMDAATHALIVIGTYNSQRDLSSSIYQSGRFEKEIILNLPNHHQRLQILKSMLDDLKLASKLTEDELRQFNLRLNGYSLGQIKQILRDAFILKENQITKDVLLEVLKKYRPSQIKELIVEVPEVYWSGIGGYEEVKHQIRKVTELPLKYPHKFEELGIQPSKGVLLYGPPGCSKTMMAKAIATESKLNFIGIKGPQLYSKYVGESERAIRNVFRKARAFSPCIIFFDQIDALATQRNDQNDVTNRLLGQLLTQMDGVQGLKEVVIIAATNRPEILDEALTRPGRFDHLIYVGPPNLEARMQIFKICLKKTPIDGDLQKTCQDLAQKTVNYTGAQITLLCREAALSALEQNIENPIVKAENFQMALAKVKSRLTPQSIARYEQFRNRLGQYSTANQLSSLTNSFQGLGLNNKIDSNNPFKF